MFLIFGFRTTARRLGMVSTACEVCQQPGAVLVREVTKLSLFFIPLLRIRTKHAVQCTNPMCGARLDLSAREARRLLNAGVGVPR